MQDFYTTESWQEIMNRLSAIREQQDFTAPNIEFVLECLSSPDDRIRGGAALAAEGCVLDPQVLDSLLEIGENDPQASIRKAAFQTFAGVIREGVLQGLEDGIGADTRLEDNLEWEDIQAGTLQEAYIRTKHLIFSVLENEYEDREVREAALLSVSDLGFSNQVKDWIRDFISSDEPSAQLTAITAMGRYPANWLKELARFLEKGVSKSLQLEAISSSYSSKSAFLAEKIVALLDTDDAEILSYSLLTLAEINRTAGLDKILQKYTVHPDAAVQEAAKEAINIFTKQNFSDFLQDELGIEY